MNYNEMLSERVEQTGDATKMGIYGECLGPGVALSCCSGCEGSRVAGLINRKKKRKFAVFPLNTWLVGDQTETPAAQEVFKQSDLYPSVEDTQSSVELYLFRTASRQTTLIREAVC